MLHILTPSHFTTSTSLFGLMRMTIRQLHQEKHQVIIIGDVDDAKRCRNQGVPVIGSCGGFLDASRTLQKRLCSYIKESNQWKTQKIMAWGWHAMSVTTDCSWEFDTYAMIDEVDPTTLGVGGHTVIPTSQSAVNLAERLGVPPMNLTEPLVGIEPTSIVIDKDTIHECFNWDGNGLFICVIGDFGSWQEILSVAVRLRSLNQRATFVLPPTYRDRALLMHAAKRHGLHHMIKEIPLKLRPIDVLLAADCSWCPSIATFDYSSNVLDVLCAASETTPLAVGTNHPIATIPTIGSQIAWASDDTEVCGWMINLKKNSVSEEEICAERVTTVRSIAAPTRFIEALQMRIHTLV